MPSKKNPLSEAFTMPFFTERASFLLSWRGELNRWWAKNQKTAKSVQQELQQKSGGLIRYENADVKEAFFTRQLWHELSTHLTTKKLQKQLNTVGEDFVKTPFPEQNLFLHDLEDYPVKSKINHAPDFVIFWANWWGTGQSDSFPELSFFIEKAETQLPSFFILENPYTLLFILKEGLLAEKEIAFSTPFSKLFLPLSTLFPESEIHLSQLESASFVPQQQDLFSTPEANLKEHIQKQLLQAEMVFSDTQKNNELLLKLEKSFIYFTSNTTNSQKAISDFTNQHSVGVAVMKKGLSFFALFDRKIASHRELVLNGKKYEWKPISEKPSEKPADIDSLSLQELTSVFGKLKTGRDALLTAHTKEGLTQQIKPIVESFNKAQSLALNTLKPIDFTAFELQWSAILKRKLIKSPPLQFAEDKMQRIETQEAQQLFFYAEPTFIDQWEEHWQGLLNGSENELIVYYSVKEGFGVSEILPNFLSKGKIDYFFPYSLNKKINIAPEGLKAFQNKYQQGVSLKSEITIHEGLHLDLQAIIKHTKNLPVLHKFSLRIFDLLPRKGIRAILPEKLENISKETSSLIQKAQQLSKGANERKKLYATLLVAARHFQENIHASFGQHQQLIEKEAAISPENIFYYLTAFLKFGTNDLSRNFKDIRIKFAPDFWQISELGRKWVTLTLHPLAPVGDWQFDWQEESPEPGNMIWKFSPSKNELHLSEGIVLKNFPPAFWAYQAKGKLFWKTWAAKKQQAFPKETPIDAAQKLKLLHELNAIALTASASVEIEAQMKTLFEQTDF